MVTEKAIYITGVSGLDPNLPDGDDDSLSEADNNIRMLKAVIKNTFPNADVPLQVSSTQLNNLPGTINYTGTNNEYITLVGPYEYDDETDKTLKLNTVNEVVPEVDGSYPVGMVFWSVLTKDELQGKYGTNYVLADGLDYGDKTEYYNITGKTAVPNVMGNRYIRPTYMYEETVSGQKVKVVEPPEVVQTEMTGKETQFTFLFDTKTHRHWMSHASHSFPRLINSDQYHIDDYDNYPDKRADTVGKVNRGWNYVGNSSMGYTTANTDPHTHIFAFANTVTGTTNEMNRLALNAFIRIK